MRLSIVCAGPHTTDTNLRRSQYRTVSFATTRPGPHGRLLLGVAKPGGRDYDTQTRRLLRAHGAHTYLNLWHTLRAVRAQHRPHRVARAHLLIDTERGLVCALVAPTSWRVDAAGNVRHAMAPRTWVTLRDAMYVQMDVILCELRWQPE